MLEVGEEGNEDDETRRSSGYRPFETVVDQDGSRLEEKWLVEGGHRKMYVESVG